MIMSKYSRIRPDFSASVLVAFASLGVSPAFAADFPAGTYSADKTPFTVSFDAKSGFHVDQGETRKVQGNYATKAGELQLTDTQGPWACTKPGEQTGAYAWKYEGGVLTFSLVSDKCDDRVKSLINRKWKRQ
jgi:hypothetical protein